ncbi:MAG: tRNA lysidine(34) synthetase TilS [Proteobacteria bacterium]|jgi:tRNA(Ile)-lysidine synthase|nr:tRNA lysidine(34) synthetase TilS [Pseudomonadota bacterium]
MTSHEAREGASALRKALGPAFTALRTLFPKDRPVVVAVSGGSDSMGLLHAAAAWARDDAGGGCTVAAGFVDHGLRDVDSEWAIVEEAARALELRAVRLLIAREEAAAAREAGSLQSWAREARYRALFTLATEVGANVVATGHTRDDQAETFLMRLLRGSGLDGLGGIPPIREQRGGMIVARPLLDLGREEIRAALLAIGARWAEDPSNADPRFLRTRIRRELLPLMEQLQPRAAVRIAATAGELRGASAYLERAVEGQGALVPLRLAGGVRADAAAFASVPRALWGRFIRHALRTVRGDLQGIDRGHYELILQLLADGKSTSRIPLPGGAVAYLYRGSLFTFPRALPQRPTGAGQPVAAGPRLWRARFAALGAVCEIEVAEDAPRSLRVADLELRARCKGDRVFGSSKKLKQLLLEGGVPRPYRDFVPVLALGDEVLSCPGHLQSRVGGIVVRWLLDDGAPFLDLDFPLRDHGY